MAFTPLTSAEIAVDAPITNGLWTKVKDNFDFLNGANTTGINAAGAPLVLNGSFESPAVASSTTPDNWTVVAGDSGAAVLVDTEQNHGAQSLKFTRGTTGTGGTATSSDFMQVSPSLRYQMRFMLLGSGSDASNSVVINWYAADQSPLSSTTVYSASTTPTSWTAFGIFVTPPATAMFAKIVLSGGTSTTNPAATRSIYFDGLSMIVKPPLTEQTVYTSTNTLTVPSGAFLCKIRGWARNGGYSEKTILVKPGDSIVVTITNAFSATSTIVHTPSSTSISIQNTSTTGGPGAGTASGGTLNVQYGSNFNDTLVSLEY